MIFGNGPECEEYHQAESSQVIYVMGSIQEQNGEHNNVNVLQNVETNLPKC